MAPARKLSKITHPQTCAGIDAGDGRCLHCDLPMSNHPITFVWPKGRER